MLQWWPCIVCNVTVAKHARSSFSVVGIVGEPFKIPTVSDGQVSTTHLGSRKMFRLGDQQSRYPGVPPLLSAALLLRARDSSEIATPIA